MKPAWLLIALVASVSAQADGSIEPPVAPSWRELVGPAVSLRGSFWSDDKRFTGAGMTTTPLLDSDIQHDATDCRAAYNQGRLQLRQ